MSKPICVEFRYPTLSTSWHLAGKYATVEDAREWIARNKTIIREPSRKYRLVQYTIKVLEIIK